MAVLKNMREEEVASITYENACNFFGIEK